MKNKEKNQAHEELILSGQDEKKKYMTYSNLIMLHDINNTLKHGMFVHIHYYSGYNGFVHLGSST